ncbi:MULTISPECIES: GNAT family N-acetyltransferase [Variovorax]|jgi:GNAT superfamily N-acetyltransferase|uniref:GNAT family N-acetyltransferase n=1 Tax=Variovorax TaxID=34072 RepID=UPI00086EB1D8|nr:MULTISPECIES: GNAT family N-acetyltransferase [Variovorax]MBN8752169.1 GNAT family N-acetyltransferase [Variovorax sp.]ODU18335.1 MAG: GNAT family N-acetyltransferase [Variovorax sp. SCN 67-85]ODV26931.1 MAG: GNAT family N-acetyltransferase [Variovorax sp. SCN 67-20]OJZ09025.1 MAG: GNAT family N-acetyltransferase [Variovorax sp. 67-131]UKI11493.1 GNAT family N-acetyltransferase [Variovorax paradoxus]
MSAGTQIEVFLADYRDAAQAAAVVALLDAYARDPAGGGESLGPAVLQGLPAALAARPQAFSVLAFEGGQPVGLINCLEGFSTFACKPLVNVHDVVVLASHRGRGVARKMFALVEQEARRRGACKLTLEVLSGNKPALRTYEREGFSNYQLDPEFGHAVFLQKKL